MSRNYNKKGIFQSWCPWRAPKKSRNQEIFCAKAFWKRQNTSRQYRHWHLWRDLY